MAELTYEEYLQLKNGKEHLEVIVNNIRVANNELNMILSAVKQNEEILENNKKLTIAYHSKYYLLSDEITAKSEELDRREKNLSARESVINTREDEINKNIDSATKKLQEITLRAKATLSYGNTLINSHRNTLRDLEENILQAKQTLSTHEETTKENNSIIKELTNEISGLAVKKEKAEQDLNIFLLSSNKEKERILISIEEEKNKVRRPLELLSEARDMIDRKQRNLDIQQRQVRKQFKILYPDRELTF